MDQFVKKTIVKRLRFSCNTFSNRIAQYLLYQMILDPDSIRIRRVSKTLDSDSVRFQKPFGIGMLKSENLFGNRFFEFKNASVPQRHFQRSDRAKLSDLDVFMSALSNYQVYLVPWNQFEILLCRSYYYTLIMRVQLINTAIQLFF